MRWTELKKADEIKAKEEAARKAAEAAKKAQKKAERENTAANLTEDQKGFRQRAANEQKRKEEVLDSRYYLSLAFSSYPELEAFCTIAHANPDELYVDGVEFANRLGIELKTPNLSWPVIRGYDKDYAEFAMDFDPNNHRRRHIPVGEANVHDEPLTLDEFEATMMDDFAGLQEVLQEARKEWEADYAYYKTHRPVKLGLFQHKPLKSKGFQDSFYDVYIWFNNPKQYQEFMAALGLEPYYNILIGSSFMEAVGQFKDGKS